MPKGVEKEKERIEIIIRTKKFDKATTVPPIQTK